MQATDKEEEQEAEAHLAEGSVRKVDTTFDDDSSAEAVEAEALAVQSSWLGFRLLFLCCG